MAESSITGLVLYQLIYSKKYPFQTSKKVC